MKLVGKELSELIVDHLQKPTYGTLFYDIYEKSCTILALYTNIRGIVDRPSYNFLKSYHPMFKEKV